MRKVVAGLILMTWFFPLLQAQQTPPRGGPTTAPAGGFPIQVHISGIHIRTHCGTVSLVGSCDDVIYADATLNGKKVDLMGEIVQIAPGNYVARIQKKSSVGGLQEIGQKYEILLTDNTYWRCTVAGFSE
jgi:hypothetical protein